MPETEVITQLPGVKVLEIQRGDKIIIRGVARPESGTKCPRCEAESFRIKSSRWRSFKHAKWERQLVYWQIRVPKLLCKRCGCYFTLRLPGILPMKRATENFRMEVFELHHGGITQLQLSRTHGISSSTVERWYQDYVVYRVKELEGRSCPVVLGIDEHFFSRKQGFATTFVDLRNHKVFDVVLGKYESDSSLRDFLEKLPGREKVKVVVMDMSEHYRRLVKKYFPNAIIVADRFHVIRWINLQFLRAWKGFDEQGRKDRSLLALMRRHEWRLNEGQRRRLQSYFQEHPEMRPLYEFKQGLVELLLKKGLRKNHVRELIPQLLWHMNECLQSPIAAFRELGSTLRRWLEPISRMWRFTKTNGITEGLHNKMEMLSRRAFGFRNFKNYRLRVIALCGWNGLFVVRPTWQN